MQTHTPMSTRYSLHMHTGKSASGYVAPSKLEAPASLKVSWADANSLVQRSAPTTIRGPKRNVSPDQLDSRYPNHGENFNANTVHSAYALPSLEGFAFKNGAPKRRKSSDRYVAEVDNSDNDPEMNIFGLYGKEEASQIRAGLVDKLRKNYEPRSQSPGSSSDSSTASSHQSRSLLRSFAGFLEYDVGIYWKIKNNKFIVWDFGPGAMAKRFGVLPGDILRNINGVDILDFKADDNGHHPVDDLVLGKRGSVCTLSFLRALEVDPSGNGDAQLGEYTVTLRRSSYAHMLDLDSEYGQEVPLHRPCFE